MSVYLLFFVSDETLEKDLLRIYTNEAEAISYGQEIADEDGLEFGYDVWVEEWKVW